PTHSFPLEEVAGYLKSKTVRDVLEQALLATPMFPTHWRWNATIALAVRRNRNGSRVPPQFQRSDSEDLLAVVFPDQLACAENIAGGYREIPEHPLVNQTMEDCLHDVMDIDGLRALLERLESGELKVVTRDLNGPSPLAQEILNARPYAFLDDAPAEERRTLAVQSRGFMDPASAAELGRLDPEAIERVRDEAWPEPRDPDEMHDALVTLGFITESEIRPELFPMVQTLCDAKRCTRLETVAEKIWVAAERLNDFLSLWPELNFDPPIAAVDEGGVEEDSPETARVRILRSRLEGLGPVTAATLGAPLGFSATETETALLTLENEGFVIRGKFSPDARSTQWCERRLLARIHRYTIRKLRAEIEPVSPTVFMRYQVRWHGLARSEKGEGEEALARTLDMLEGFAAPAAAWESDILPARIRAYLPNMLDSLCASGRYTWLRVAPPKNGNSPVRTTPITLVSRENLPFWQHATADEPELSSAAQQVRSTLTDRGASFFSELVQQTGLLRTQVENALGELVASGLATSDSFAGLRALITPASKRPPFSRRRRRGAVGVDRAGRWALIGHAQPADRQDEKRVEHVARSLLRRYGVVFRRLLDRETGLPPWRELLYCYRRLEARGEIRGGRFVEGFSGEQFALREALPVLRALRRKTPLGELIALSAADPLNLTGIVTPGDRVPAHASNRLVLRDGVPVAWQTGGETHLSENLDETAAMNARQKLVRQRTPASFASPGARFPRH
ncbi:MAG: ATP-dependent DNA helicase, partial [Gammaproteobacteria bacterium]